MGLRWPILLLPVVIGIAVAAWFALRRSRHGWQGELPYLARGFRLTELPGVQARIAAARAPFGCGPRLFDRRRHDAHRRGGSTNAHV